MLTLSRGAGNSAGKTSWTAKAERYDFQSVVAFVAYYVHHLERFKHGDSATEDADGTGSTISRETTNPLETNNILVIGGYSYGSLIAAQLPPLDAILETFSSPASDSNEAQIRLRAASLAEQQNTLIGLTRKALREIHATRAASSRSVRVGGDEGPTSPRRSTDGHGRRHVSREMLEEKIHELVARTKSVAQRHHRHVSAGSGTLRKVPEHAEPEDGAAASGEKKPDIEPAGGRLPPLPSFKVPQQAYVLISPIPGIASHLVTMRLLPHSLSRSRHPEDDPAEAKLVQHPTLAVHGDADMFVLPYKVREWVSRLEGPQGSKFRGVEVAAAGHFWAEEGVMETLLGLVGEFMRGLLVHDADRGAESGNMERGDASFPAEL